MEMAPYLGTQFPIKINKYLLLKLIGEGGFGKVYKAVDQENIKDYAIKKIDLRFMTSQEISMELD
jgi:serine/threonine protein kinase